MSRTQYRLLVAGALLLVLGAVNFTIWQREDMLKNGTVVMLELAPVDPRSLMQGDYMALRFALSRELSAVREGADPITEGDVVVKRDARNVGVYQRIHRDGETLAADEARIHFRVRRQDIRIATDAFFFREGSAGAYRSAHYGELRVTPGGDATLVALRDKDLKLLGEEGKQ